MKKLKLFLYLKCKQNQTTMSTRSNIAITLREEDKGKTFKTKFGTDFYIDPMANFLVIYIHHDGYLDGVGKDLLNNLKTYEQVLDFILEGDRTSFDTSYTSTGECYEDNEPAQYINIDHISQEYFYLYTMGGSDNEYHWLVSKQENYGDGPRFLNSLEEAIANLKK